MTTHTVQVMFGDGRAPVEDQYPNWLDAYSAARILKKIYEEEVGVFVFCPSGKVLEVMTNGFRRVGFC